MDISKYKWFLKLHILWKIFYLFVKNNIQCFIQDAAININSWTSYWTGWYNSNVLDLCLGGTQFESCPVNSVEVSFLFFTISPALNCYLKMAMSSSKPLPTQHFYSAFCCSVNYNEQIFNKVSRTNWKCVSDTACIIKYVTISYNWSQNAQQKTNFRLLQERITHYHNNSMVTIGSWNVKLL